MQSPIRSRAWWEKSRAAFVRVATGGDWAIPQPPAVRRNLIWFWLDGFFASASDNIFVTYLVVYLIALGATQAQIGLMSALSSLSAAIVLLPGAMLVERAGSRRPIVVLGGGWARMAVLLMAALPFVADGPLLVYLAIGLSISRDTLNNLMYPAWMSLTGDLVPLEGRGRYFSSRNVVMGAAGIATTFLAGQMITRMVEPVGFQVALILAAALGFMAVFSFSRLSEKMYPLSFQQVKVPLSLKAMLRDLRSQRELSLFVAVTALWNFSINVAGPFFNVYLVNNLRADAAMIGLTAIASTLATMLAQRKMGDLNDRWGARRLVIVSGLLIPIVPLLWAFTGAAWQIIPVNLLSGLLWAGYNLAAFNYLLMITPPERRARYSAQFQIVVTVSLALGAAVGSMVVEQVGIQALFIWSGIGRFAAALLFAFFTARAARAAAGVESSIGE